MRVLDIACGAGELMLRMARYGAWLVCHSGFSVHVGAPIKASEPKSVERVGRYLVRAPVALGKVHPQKDGRVKLLTPPDPKTGVSSRLFDPLDWVAAEHDADPRPPPAHGALLRGVLQPCTAAVPQG